MSMLRPSWGTARARLALGVVALVATGVVAALLTTGPAAAEDGDLRTGWPTWIVEGKGGVLAAGGGSEMLRLRSKEVRSASLDVEGGGNFDPGDYTVFEERLFDQDGRRVGRDSIRCMRIVNSFACDGTLHIEKRGNIQVAGAAFFGTPDFTIAVVGGTGGFKGAAGTLTVRRHLVIELE